MNVTLEEVLAWLDEEAAKAEAKIPLPGMGGFWEDQLGTVAYQAPARRIVALYRTAAEHIRAMGWRDISEADKDPDTAWQWLGLEIDGAVCRMRWYSNEDGEGWYDDFADRDCIPIRIAPFPDGAPA